MIIKKFLCIFFLIWFSLLLNAKNVGDELSPISLLKTDIYMKNFNKRFEITNFVRYKTFDVKTMSGIVADTNTSHCLLVNKTETDVYIKEEQNPNEVYYYMKIMPNVWYSFRYIDAYDNAYYQAVNGNLTFGYDIFVCNDTIWELKTNYIPEKRGDLYKKIRKKTYKKKIDSQEIIYKQDDKCIVYKNNIEETRIYPRSDVLEKIKYIVQNFKKPQIVFRLNFNGNNFEYVWSSGEKVCDSEIKEVHFWDKKNPNIKYKLKCNTIDMVNIYCGIK